MLMDLSGISWVAVIVAIVANMVVGFLWYGPLFGKQWMAAVGMKESDVPAASPTMYLVPVLATLVMSVVLYNIVGDADLGSYLSAAFGVWVGFIALTSLTNHIFRDGKVNLWVLEAGNHLVGLLVVGASLALF